MKKKRLLIVSLIFISVSPIFASSLFKVEGTISEQIQFINYSDSKNIFINREIELCPKFVFDSFSIGGIVYSGKGKDTLSFNIYENLGDVTFLGLGLECGLNLEKIALKLKVLGKLALYSSDYGSLHSLTRLGASIDFKILSYKGADILLCIPLSVDFSSYGLSYSAGVGVCIGKYL